jgi:hypothetical protein
MNNPFDNFNDDDPKPNILLRPFSEIVAAVIKFSALSQLVWLDRNHPPDPTTNDFTLLVASLIATDYPDDLGPYTDFQWGMINGKLSALRWVLGLDWGSRDPEACMAIVSERMEAMQQVLATGGPDKDAVCRHCAAKTIAELLAEREPRGLYDPKAFLQLGNGLAVHMARATKQDVVQWRQHMAKNPEEGCNFANLLYADTRLALWAEGKNLAELEALLDADNL